MPGSPPAIIEISDSEDEAPNIKVQPNKNQACIASTSSRSNNHQSTSSRIDPVPLIDSRKVKYI